MFNRFVMLAPVLVTGAVLSGCGGDAAAPSAAPTATVTEVVTAAPDTSYDADDELEFAQSGHSCRELEEWYDHNPGDSNLDIAQQYLDTCNSVPPPVLSFELVPWDEESLFTVMLEDSFPENLGPADQFVGLGKGICEGFDLGMTRSDFDDLAIQRNVTTEQNDKLVTAAVTTLCPEHETLLAEAVATPSAPDEGDAADDLEAALRSSFPSATFTRRQMVRMAKDTCDALEAGYGAESTIFAMQIVGARPKPAATMAGMAVTSFCPDMISRINP